MIIVSSKITRKEIIEKHLTHFKTLVKAVVDIERKIIALDAELHSDLEAYLLENGSKQENLWGANLYPTKNKEDFVEYTALINIRPNHDNYSMEITNPDIREKNKKNHRQFYIV